MRKIVPFFAAAVLALAGGVADAEVIFKHFLLGRPFNLVIPTGYCALGASAQENRWFDNLSALLGRGNFLILMFANCGQLEAFRQDESREVAEYGVYMVPLPNGEVTTLPAGYPRSKAMAELANQFPRYSEPTLEESIDKQFSELGTEGDIKQNPTRAKLLDANDDAVFAGFGVWRGKRVRVGGVMALTIIDRLVMAIHLFDEYRGRQSFLDLLDQQRDLAARLVEVNVP